ncbi:MAG: hypothetical protein A2Y25_02790 [Candidatus Melainabacteria bacterium GWF2_37_15]|nr:MAG: hypothetical protein A2Y25_02790 [Candidatus Melainabacteria bacterium GWF2_37_15]
MESNQVKIFNALENGIFRKIICGAANSSEQQVERIALVYALAGTHVIDIGPQENIYNVAKRGIYRALDINPELIPPIIMTSVNVGDDKHFRKASFNLSQCVQCLECVKTCDINKDPEKCYGCARCVEACQHNAVTMVKMPGNLKIKNYDAIEIHTGNSTLEEVQAFVEINRMALDKAILLSVSIDSGRFNTIELIDYANSIVNMFGKKIIIQIDGLSMRGGTKKSSTLSTLAAASTLLDAEVNAYIQLSGGTNHLTQEIVNMTGLKISGIGFGSFAKKIILNYIEKQEDIFGVDLNKIVKVAESLVKKG